MEAAKMSLAVGLMSGTSMDGIDACLVEINPVGRKEGKEEEEVPQVTLLRSLTRPYPAGVREALMELSRGQGSAADVCTYNRLLGQLFAEAAQTVVREAGYSMEQVSVIGSHGQTLLHLSQPRFLHGYSISSSLQIADPSSIAAHCGVTTVGDFRMADISVGGEGAPLVPYMDRALLRRHYERSGSVGMMLNVGGICNVSIWLPGRREMVGFDCGPGGILIDTLMSRWYGMDYDRDGQKASEGAVNGTLLKYMEEEDHSFLHREPPKSTGREDYDGHYLEKVVSHSEQLGLSYQDTIATVTAYTAVAVSINFQQHIIPRLRDHPPQDIFVSGGGAKNSTLMKELEERLSGVTVITTAALGVDPDAKEAMCFALLGYQAVRGQTTNEPSVTGAKRRVILGKICPVIRTPSAGLGPITDGTAVHR